MWTVKASLDGRPVGTPIVTKSWRKVRKYLKRVARVLPGVSFTIRRV